MNKDEILNRLSLKKHNVHFNQINGMYDRAMILDEALDEAIEQINLTIPDAKPSFSLLNNEAIYLLRKNQPTNCPKWIDGVGDCHRPDCNHCRIEKCIEALEGNEA